MISPNSFAQGSDLYARARPRYPDGLFEWIAATCHGHDRAWDCATGNGQAAIGLARIFREVEATDISAEQVEEAFTAPNVQYSAQPAERTGFPDASFDLIAVAQALHWFDFNRFWPEVRRVAKPGALFCAWGYAWFRGSQEVQASLFDPVLRLVEPYWASNNRLLWRGYRDEEVHFPFRRLEAPDLRIEVDWSTAEIVGYVRTWSAFKNASADGQGEQLDRILSDAERRLASGCRHELWVPLTLLAGFVD